MERQVRLALTRQTELCGAYVAKVLSRLRPADYK
jgi:hypothetical protein